MSAESEESGRNTEITTVKVTRAQADAIQHYVKSREDLNSAREALDELGVAELDPVDGTLPVERRFDRIENAVEETYERLVELEDAIAELNQKIE